MKIDRFIFQFLIWIAGVLFFVTCFHGGAKSAACLESFTATDTPNDGGGSITLRWKLREGCDAGGSATIYRREEGDATYEEAGTVRIMSLEYEDESVRSGVFYEYRIETGVGGELESMTSAAVKAKLQLFNRNRLNAFLLFLVFCSIVIVMIIMARQGKKLFIRRISGLNAIDEAIGRATEMGRKVLYIPGIMSMDEIQTIASISILGYIARYAAEFRTNLEVPNKDPITFAATRETVREAFMASGHPDAYSEDMVTYLTYDQFAYTASISGKMVREKPATNFLIGSFFAESLLLAEMGQSIGAIQIAGTAEISQLPFFVAACDYTMIGEELYAASAYISKDPLMVGSIKGQDWMKLILLILLVLGVLLESFGIGILSDFFTPM